jgi:hypothetical protein
VAGYVRERLAFNTSETARLEPQDRVGTYAGAFLANVAPTQHGK